MRRGRGGGEPAQLSLRLGDRENGANLLRRDINDRSSEVDFGVVLNAGEHEENACKSIWVGESAPLSESRWSKVVWSKAALTQPPNTLILTPEWRE